MPPTDGHAACNYSRILHAKYLHTHNAIMKKKTSSHLELTTVNLKNEIKRAMGMENPAGIGLMDRLYSFFGNLASAYLLGRQC